MPPQGWSFDPMASNHDSAGFGRRAAFVALNACHHGFNKCRTLELRTQIQASALARALIPIKVEKIGRRALRQPVQHAIPVPNYHIGAVGLYPVPKYPLLQLRQNQKRHPPERAGHLLKRAESRRPTKLELIGLLLQVFAYNECCETLKKSNTAGHAPDKNGEFCVEKMRIWAAEIDEIIRGWPVIGPGVQQGLLAIVRAQGLRSTDE